MSDMLPKEVSDYFEKNLLGPTPVPKEQDPMIDMLLQLMKDHEGLYFINCTEKSDSELKQDHINQIMKMMGDNEKPT